MGAHVGENKGSRASPSPRFLLPPVAAKICPLSRPAAGVTGPRLLYGRVRCAGALRLFNRAKAAASGGRISAAAALSTLSFPVLRAWHARPREAPGLSVGSLRAACRQATLKPTLAQDPHRTQNPRLPTGATIISVVRGYSAATISACAVRSMM